MTSELELCGRLLAFKGIVEQELELLGLDVQSLIPHLKHEPSDDLREGLNNALAHVTYIARQCLNVHGHNPPPSPLEPRKEV